MRALAISSGLAVALVLGSWISGFGQPALAPQGGQPAADTQVLSVLLPQGMQQIVVVDTRQQSMAVYHIANGTGKIELKSVRKIQMDMAIEQFNASEPLPSEMRLLKQ